MPEKVFKSKPRGFCKSHHLRYNRKSGKCLTPCYAPQKRRSNFPYDCYYPRKVDPARKCKKKSNQWLSYTEPHCMKKCPSGQVRSRSPKKKFACYSPKKRGSKK